VFRNEDQALFSLEPAQVLEPRIQVAEVLRRLGAAFNEVLELQVVCQTIGVWSVLRWNRTNRCARGSQPEHGIDLALQLRGDLFAAVDGGKPAV
jgi:hypothetical protein